VPLLPELVRRAGSPISDEDRQNLEALATELPEIVLETMESCKVMRNITDGMREFLNQRRVGAAPPMAEPLPIIRHAIAVCRETVVRARGRLQYEGAAELPRVRIDATELSQICINVVANAAQALLARDQRGGRVVIHAAVDGKLVRFTVTDDGPGMSEETLKRVGTPFFSTREGGTGLGVAQSRRLVARAGGELSIKSQLGEGTSVIFTIPLA
jgi:signal transduction histidine kinase